MKLFIFLFFSIKLFNFKITYIFSENSIFNVTKNDTIENTTLEILESEEYYIKGNCEKANIIINANYVILHIISAHLNTVIKSLITVNEQKSNIIIYLYETILSNSYDSGIFELKKDSSLLINSKSSIIKGGIILKGEKESNIKIKGLIGLTNKNKFIDINTYISEDFILLCENEKIKFDDIKMEIISESILTQKQVSIKHSTPFKNHIINQSSQIFNHETNLLIKNKNIFEETNKKKENNTFYLDYLYFKHVNIAKEKYEEKIIKYSNITFKPKVSVIIPIYNVEKYLPLCIESIINQTLKEIEIICINDGSTDDSLFIILKYSKKDNRIMIINQRNRGLSEARNIGLKNANGEYIYFIDSDDYLEENALFELYEYGIKYKLDVIYFQYSIFHNDENIVKNISDENVNNSNFTIEKNNNERKIFIC